MYTAYGLAAVKAAAPFLGTLVLVFTAAHLLDKANDTADATATSKQELTAQGVGSSAVGAVGAGAGAGQARNGAGGASSTVPKRRRVAD